MRLGSKTLTLTLLSAAAVQLGLAGSAAAQSTRGGRDFGCGLPARADSNGSRGNCRPRGC